MASALGIAGLGLIGLGAHATFTQTAYTNQAITAGTLNVALSSSGGSWTSPTLTMASVGPVGSSFTTGDQQVTITNNGNITVTGMTLSFTYPASGVTFRNEAQICVFYGTTVLYNGSFTGFTGSVTQALSIAPTATDKFFVNVYAGPTEAVGCGNDGAPSLDNGAMGETVNPTLTAVFTG